MGSKIEAGSKIPFAQFYYANTTMNNDFARLGGRRHSARTKNHAPQQREIDLGTYTYDSIPAVPHSED